MTQFIILICFSTIITIALLYILFSKRFDSLTYCRKIDYAIRIIIFLFYLILAGSRHYVIHITYQIKEWGINYAFFVLPIANVSPFTFTLVFISMFLPKKIKSVCDGFVLCVSLAMPIATITSCVVNVVNNDPYHFSAIFDVLCHLLICGLSIYLYKTKQIPINKKMLIWSYIFIYSVIVILVIINVIFKVSFFGLGFHDNWTIYGVKLFDNPFLNLFVYCLGLAIIMFGVFMIYWLKDKKRRPDISTQSFATKR